MLTAEKRKYTAKDYQLLEEGAPFQLINSELVISPSPLYIHQQIVLNIALQIKLYLQSSGTGGEVVISPMDVKLDDINIFQPDILYISENRKHIIKERIDGAPDLIIEVLSPTTAYYDLRQKKDIYEQYNVLEYIIIDPGQLNAESHVLENGRFTLKQKAQKTEKLNSNLLSGLVIDLQKIFVQY